MTAKVVLEDVVAGTFNIALVLFPDGSSVLLESGNGSQDATWFERGEIGKARKVFYITEEQTREYVYGGDEPDIDELWEKHLDAKSFWEHERDREMERRGGTIW